MRYYLAALASLLVLCQIAAYVVNKPYLPPFTDVAMRAASDHQNLLRNLASTLARIAAATSLALAAGLACGRAASWLTERTSGNLLKALILFTYPIPHVAFAVTAAAPTPYG